MQRTLAPYVACLTRERDLCLCYIVRCTQVNMDLVTLALYDIVIWADDSTSMQALDNGERIEDLKAILGRVADAATLFDDDGAPPLPASKSTGLGISSRWKFQRVCGRLAGNCRFECPVVSFCPFCCLSGLQP